ncbi:Lrp/AsnC family transcriptional regulator [Vibrio sp. SCSIO 43135]|uniref:Lrp/AsnC family transcriptional regulator n=1 Tax=Vibrio sp. SCSIO 43135 TaxID=2819096 RepID=UPI002075E9C6|nr:Lrp/AsnC family transcriptional regulator [Vibrio sp. SCSIO 43135]USD43711.1 Lrp/AsnC family transcriptional regulator [Vibrio sp. SCSIO 43135]
MKKKESIQFSLDDTDLAILELIQKEGRMSNSKLAERLHLSETPCWRRWKRLEEEGFIDGYSATLNRKRMGYQVVGFTFVTLGSHEVENTEPFEEFAQNHAWVQMCHCIAGSADYIVQIVAKDLDDYFEHISAMRRVKGVSSIQSNVSVKEVKTHLQLPLG